MLAVYKKGIFPFIAALVLFIAQWVFAAPSPYHLKPGKISPPISEGVVTGGRSSDEFSLLNVKAESLKNQERFSIVFGDRYGQPLQGDPGYFHLSVDRSGKRISIDLAQVSRTAVDNKQLRRLLSRSKYIASSDMVMDPHDGSTNIALNMKVPVTVKVMAPQKTIPGRVILEIRPQGTEQK